MSFALCICSPQSVLLPLAASPLVGTVYRLSGLAGAGRAQEIKRTVLNYRKVKSWLRVIQSNNGRVKQKKLPKSLRLGKTLQLYAPLAPWISPFVTFITLVAIYLMPVISTRFQALLERTPCLSFSLCPAPVSRAPLLWSRWPKYLLNVF